MCKNLPVTKAETAPTPTDYPISCTDLKGRIVLINPAFVRTSGYSHEELAGVSYSLMCHPSMPEAAFVDLWATLQAGEAWRGFVEGRRRDDDFYWVLANVAPVFQSNAAADYTSVRLMVAPAQIVHVQRVYTAINEGDTSYIVCAGRILRTGWRCAVDLFRINGLRFEVVGLQTLVASIILISTVWAHMTLETVDPHDAARLVFSRDRLWFTSIDCARLATISDVLLACMLIRPLEEAATLVT